MVAEEVKKAYFQGMKDNDHLLKEFDQPAVYEIVVNGTVSPGSYLRFQGLTAVSGYLADGKPKTVLTGLFTDQARLGELLNVIYEQQLAIISVRKISE